MHLHRLLKRIIRKSDFLKIALIISILLMSYLSTQFIHVFAELSKFENINDDVGFDGIYHIEGMDGDTSATINDFFSTTGYNESIEYQHSTEHLGYEVNFSTSEFKTTSKNTIIIIKRLEELKSDSCCRFFSSYCFSSLLMNQNIGDPDDSVFLLDDSFTELSNFYSGGLEQVNVSKLEIKLRDIYTGTSRLIDFETDNSSYRFSIIDRYNFNKIFYNDSTLFDYYKIMNPKYIICFLNNSDYQLYSDVLPISLNEVLFTDFNDDYFVFSNIKGIRRFYSDFSVHLVDNDYQKYKSENILDEINAFMNLLRMNICVSLFLTSIMPFTIFLVLKNYLRILISKTNKKIEIIRKFGGEFSFLKIWRRVCVVIPIIIIVLLSVFFEILLLIHRSSNSTTVVSFTLKNFILPAVILTAGILLWMFHRFLYAPIKKQFAGTRSQKRHDYRKKKSSWLGLGLLKSRQPMLALISMIAFIFYLVAKYLLNGAINVNDTVILIFLSIFGGYNLLKPLTRFFRLKLLYLYSSKFFENNYLKRLINRIYDSLSKADLRQILAISLLLFHIIFFSGMDRQVYHENVQDFIDLDVRLTMDSKNNNFNVSDFKKYLLDEGMECYDVSLCRTRIGSSLTVFTTAIVNYDLYQLNSNARIVETRIKQISNISEKIFLTRGFYNKLGPVPGLLKDFMSYIQFNDTIGINIENQSLVSIKQMSGIYGNPIITENVVDIVANHFDEFEYSKFVLNTTYIINTNKSPDEIKNWLQNFPDNYRPFLISVDIAENYVTPGLFKGLKIFQNPSYTTSLLLNGILIALVYWFSVRSEMKELNKYFFDLLNNNGFSKKNFKKMKRFDISLFNLISLGANLVFLLLFSYTFVHSYYYFAF